MQIFKVKMQDCTPVRIMAETWSINKKGVLVLSDGVGKTVARFEDFAAIWAEGSQVGQ